MMDFSDTNTVAYWTLLPPTPLPVLALTDCVMVADIPDVLLLFEVAALVVEES